MRRVSLEFIEPGMVVGRSIYNSEGRPLLGVGMVLNEKYIRRLKELGIGAIFIKDSLFDQCEEPVDIISEQTRLESINAVKEIYKSFETKKRMSTERISRTVNNLIDELISKPEILVNCADIRSHDDYTFAHSVQVCVLSLMTGITLGCDHKQLKEMGTGALTHDIGKTLIDIELLNKPGKLTPKEYEMIKNHAQFGFDILRSDQQFSLLSAHIALQHHELGDGKGYPRGISGKEIHPYARIVTVADVFDALVADRPYRKAYSTDQAIAIMKQRSGASFEPAYLEALFSNIAQFPIGSVVALNTQEIAIIVDNNRETPTRPVVRVIIDRHNRELNKPLEIDLTKDHLVEISRVLSEEEISILLKELSEPRIRDTM